jgi:hypothetical protein
MSDEAISDAIAALAARVDTLAAGLSLACETPTIAALLTRKAQIESDIAAGEESLAQIAQKQEALQQRVAALDDRERAIKVQQFVFDQRFQEALSTLRATHKVLVQADEAARIRVLNYAHMLEGFDIGIRELPSWPAIEKMLGVADAIPEVRVELPTKNVREDWNGDQFAPSTLTRSVPALMSDHDDLALPTNKTPERSRRPRGYRAAMRAAMAKP